MKNDAVIEKLKHIAELLQIEYDALERPSWGAAAADNEEKMDILFDLIGKLK